MGRSKKIKKPTPLEPIDKVVEPIPIPWDEVVRELLRRPIRLPARVKEGQLTLIWVRTQAWEMALHWLIKWEWHSKHKVPVSPSLARKYEAKGRVLHSLFLLCERCHTLQDAVPQEKIDYRHAAYWFGLVYWELIWFEVQDAIRSRPTHKGETKDAALAERRAFLKTLQDLEDNPFPPEMEATHKLFAIASTLAGKSQSNVFKAKYWDVFLKAYRSESQQLRSEGYTRIFCEEGRTYAQLGRGKGRVEIKPPEHWKQELEKMNFISLTE